MTYKIGDTVTCIEGGKKGSGWRLGYTFEITSISNYDYDIENIYWEDRQSIGGVFESSLKLVNSKQPIMTNLVSTVKTLFTPEPEKSFQKTGITDQNGTLTADGQTVFLSWLLAQNKESFNKDIVQPLLAEQQKK